MALVNSYLFTTFCMAWGFFACNFISLYNLKGTSFGKDSYTNNPVTQKDIYLISISWDRFRLGLYQLICKESLKLHTTNQMTNSKFS